MLEIRRIVVEAALERVGERRCNHRATCGRRGEERGQRDEAELPPGLTFGDVFGQSNTGHFSQSDRGSGQSDQSKNGKSPSAGQSNAADFGKRQKALQGRVENLQSRLKDAASSDLEKAKDAMIAAENALRQGPRGNGAAAEAQGRAVEALREGAQKLAESMSGQGEGTGPGGEGEEQGAPGQFGAPGGSDPLGRPAGRDDGYANFPAGYDPAAASPAERARRVLEELRRRIGEPARPREEMDYLERLLRRY